MGMGSRGNGSHFLVIDSGGNRKNYSHTASLQCSSNTSKLVLRIVQNIYHKMWDVKNCDMSVSK